MSKRKLTVSDDGAMIEERKPFIITNAKIKEGSRLNGPRGRLYAIGYRYSCQ